MTIIPVLTTLTHRKGVGIVDNSGVNAYQFKIFSKVERGRFQSQRRLINDNPVISAYCITEFSVNKTDGSF